MAGHVGKTSRFIATFVASLLLLASPLPAQEASGPTMSMDGWPEWLVTAMAQETNRPGQDKVRLPVRNFRSSLVGNAHSEPEDVEIGWYLTSDIKSDAPLECWVLNSTVDPASMVLNLVNLGMQAVSEAHGEISEQFVYYVDAGTIGDYPYLAYETLYTMGTAPDVRVGLVKVRIASKDGMQFVCSHNQLGYRETFARGFERFVSKASFDAEDQQTYLREISALSLNDQPVGYINVAYGTDADGDTVVTTQSASLMPVDATTVSAEDAYDIGFWTPDGELINRRVAQARNGEMEIELDLVNNGDDTFSVTGQFQGKPLELEISGVEAPLSPLAQMFATQQLIADKERDSLTLSIWEPTVDPTQFLPATFEFDPDRRDELIGTSRIGPMEMLVQLDKFGSAKIGRLSIGASAITVERLRVVGEHPTVADVD